ncbi:MAG: hypothetical protein LH479_08465 [Polaromonas sp.]|nr:hypothetical protein [Polaromonas sp.]
MNRRTFSLSAIGAIASSLAACGGGGGAAGSPAGSPATVQAPGDPVKDTGLVVQPSQPVVELASATLLPAGTVFLQSVSATDRDPEAAPGQANFWDLRVDLSLGDGFNNQFSGALQLSVDLGTNVQPFPSDQTYSGLTAFGPALGESDGVKSVTFVGPNNAHLHPVRGARLQQTLNLSGAQAPITLTWTSLFNAAAFAATEAFIDEPFSWQVVLRASAGVLLETIYRVDQDNLSGTGTGSDGSGNLSAYAGQAVALSFEQDSPAYGSRVASVSVTDATKEYVVNGNFASGGSGWTVPPVQVSQNVQSAARTLHDLAVRRMFYTQPDALWARWTDTFTNSTRNPISVTARYDSTLGSEGRGIIYATPGATTKALTSWDGSDSSNIDRDRDIGMVFGDMTPTFSSASARATATGSASVGFAKTISVPAGGSVTLVNFIVLSGTDTGLTAASIGARASAVDLLAADIANNFRTHFGYRRGMMQAQLDTLQNF